MSRPDVATAIVWLFIVVVAVAAAGKAIGPHRRADLLVAGVELALACALGWLAAGVWIAVLLVGMALAYTVNALLRSPAGDCHCFGSRLPGSSRGIQRARNTLLLGLALLYCFLTSEPAPRPVQATEDVAVGIVLGLGVIALPWLMRWALSQRTYARPRHRALPLERMSVHGTDDTHVRARVSYSSGLRRDSRTHFPGIDKEVT